jgi:sortase A
MSEQGQTPTPSGQIDSPGPSDTPPGGGTPARPRRARRFIRRASSVLLVVGGLVLSYPFWSGAYAWVNQGRIDRQLVVETQRFEQAMAAEMADIAQLRSRELRLQRLAEAFGKRLVVGRPLGRLTIAKIGLETPVLEGARRPLSLARDVDQDLLRLAPVHYGLTPLPGAGQPFAVAGHRTTYGAPFLHVNDLVPGDAIVVTTPYARLRYTVARKTVVKPSDVTVLYDRGYDLVLTTCHPPYSARSRLIIWGRLDNFVLR